MSNALDFVPKTWDQYWGNDEARVILQRAIANNNHPPAITLSGSSGTGKTTLATLYIKSTLCKNRKDGDFNPCGYCSSCKNDPRTVGQSGGVTWVQQGQNETINSRINSAIDDAHQPPMGLSEEHTHYKFVVIDELQSVPKNQIHRLLFFPELSDIQKKNKVIFIFITMDEDAIDPGVMKPLADRSTYLPFPSPTNTEVFEFLKSVRPDISLESLAIFAATAKGSYRSALSHIDTAERYDPSLDSEVVARLMRYADAKSRTILWKAIRRGNFKELYSYWNILIKRVDPIDLIGLLSLDIEHAMLAEQNEAQIVANELIYSFLVSKAKARPFDLLKVLIKKPILDPDKVYDDFV
jgi:DNA polymerase-3 subunit gamma/tau